MADRTTKQGFGALGVGAAACAACCAPPIIGFLAAASVGTLIGVALFGVLGLAVTAIAAIVYIRRRAAHHPAKQSTVVPVALGRKPDA